MKHPACLLLSTALLALAGPVTAAGFTPADAQSVIEKNQDAMIAVHATLSIKPELIDGPPGIGEMLAQQPEQSQEVDFKGVMIHRTGVVAAPLVALDPGGVLGGAIELDTPLGKLKLGLKCTISAVKIICADGKEYPADVILKEPSAGLALLKITTPPADGLTAVALVKDLPVPQPFSRMIGLTRLSADFGHAACVRLMRFVTATPPPFPMHDITGPTGEPGSAAFDGEGRFRGLIVVPFSKKADSAAAISGYLLPPSEILRLGAKALP